MTTAQQIPETRRRAPASWVPAPDDPKPVRDDFRSSEPPKGPSQYPSRAISSEPSKRLAPIERARAANGRNESAPLVGLVDASKCPVGLLKPDRLTDEGTCHTGTPIQRAQHGASGTPTPPKKGRVTWPEVLRVLQDDETRSCALASFRTSGFDAETFGRKREAREAIADGLTRTEDRLEYRELDRGRGHVDARRQRLAISDVRRLLERELWP